MIYEFIQHLCFFQLKSVQMLLVLILSAFAVPYDHSFTHHCLLKPLKPLYGGGIVVTPQLGLIKYQLEPNKLYAFSAWLRTKRGNAYVQATFVSSAGNFSAGWVAARDGCWSMLKGGFVPNVTGPVEVELVFNSSSDGILASSISIQPFTEEEWKSHWDESVGKVRKGKVKIRVLDRKGKPVENATVFVNQTRPAFPLGCAMNSYTVENERYRNWFVSRFKHYTVFENEFRWPYVARNRSCEDYTGLDKLFSFTKSHGLAVRGHPVHTSSRVAQPNWISDSTLNEPESFQVLVNARTKSLVGRYLGQVIHWDVVNENLHDGFFDAVLGDNASTVQYQMVHGIDPHTPLFLNEYYTIEDSEDELASPWKYLQKVWKIREQGYHGPLGIGVAGRFSKMNLPYVRASLDVLESLDLPIWITELLVTDEAGFNRANYLDQIMMELLAHRAVDGIMIWAAKWASGKCWKMCLTDNNFVNLDTGDVVDKIMGELTYVSGLHGTTDFDGSFESSLFYGEYEAQVSHPTLQTPTSSWTFKVAPTIGAQYTPLVLEIRA